MEFLIGDTVKIKKFKKGTPKHMIYGKYTGKLFKITVRHLKFINGLVITVYNLKGPVNLYDVPKDYMLLKKRAKQPHIVAYDGYKKEMLADWNHPNYYKPITKITTNGT